MNHNLYSCSEANLNHPTCSCRALYALLCRINGVRAPPPLLPYAQKHLPERMQRILARRVHAGQPVWLKPARAGAAPSARSRQAAAHWLPPLLPAGPGEAGARSRRLPRGARVYNLP